MDGSGISETSETSGTAAPRTPLWPWILSIIKVMLACIIAGFVANDMIELPWLVRLFGFISVLGSYFINPIIFFIIVVYYIFRALYATFKGESQKTPYWFALLPLHTAKANNSWILWPFTYLEQGVKDPMEEVLDKRIEPATIKALQEAFPAYDKWKSTLSKQVDDFKAFLGNINLTEFSPAKKESPSASPSASSASDAAASASASSASASSATASASSAPAPAAPAASASSASFAPGASGAAAPAAPAAPAASASSASSAPGASGAAAPGASGAAPSSVPINNSNKNTPLLNNRLPKSGSGPSARGSYVPPVVPGAAPLPQGSAAPPPQGGAANQDSQGLSYLGRTPGPVGQSYPPQPPGYRQLPK